ncbi:MAG: hypothetical protein M3Y48_07810 [Actinomycetota bacterium]|nr:hypothetical protein [Actinomycetota bacterium]
MTADADPDLLAWIVLSRVNDGDVTRQHGTYFDRGEPAPDYLAGLFARLTDSGSLVLADPVPPGGNRSRSPTQGASGKRSAARGH